MIAPIRPALRRAAIVLACAVAACARQEPAEDAAAVAPQRYVPPIRIPPPVPEGDDPDAPDTSIVVVALTAEERARAARLAADGGGASIGCRRITPRRPVPENEITEDLRGGVRFSCVLRPGRPPVEAFVEADSVGYAVALHVNLPTTRLRQVLDTGFGERPYREAPILESLDYDRDGWGDLRMLHMWGATGNRIFNVWLYDPARQRFVRNRVLSDSTGGAEPVAGTPIPCVRDHWNGGHAGLIYSEAMHCVRDGVWTLEETETQEHIEGDRYILERRRRMNGEMVLVSRDTLVLGMEGRR